MQVHRDFLDRREPTGAEAAEFEAFLAARRAWLAGRAAAAGATEARAWELRS